MKKKIFPGGTNPDKGSGFRQTHDDLISKQFSILLFPVTIICESLTTILAHLSTRVQHPSSSRTQSNLRNDPCRFRQRFITFCR